MAYLKPQSPIKYKEDHIYPLTTADQIIMDSGNRLSGVGVYLEKPDGEDTTVQGNNADTLGGIAASNFVLETELDTYKDNVATNYLLKTETASDSNKLGGIDASEFLQKNQVVNNLTTEEEGLIADARALKSLKDGIDYASMIKSTYEGSLEVGKSITFPTNPHDVIMISCATWNYKLFTFVAPQNGSVKSYDIFKLSSSISVSSDGAWGVVLTNNSNIAQNYYAAIFKNGY